MSFALRQYEVLHGVPLLEREPKEGPSVSEDFKGLDVARYIVRLAEGCVRWRMTDLIIQMRRPALLYGEPVRFTPQRITIYDFIDRDYSDGSSDVLSRMFGFNAAFFGHIKTWLSPERLYSDHTVKDRNNVETPFKLRWAVPEPVTSFNALTEVEAQYAPEEIYDNGFCGIRLFPMQVMLDSGQSIAKFEWPDGMAPAEPIRMRQA